MSKQKNRCFKSSKNAFFFQKFSSRERPPWCFDSPPLQIHFSIWPHRSAAPTKRNYRRIPLDQTNLQISSISAFWHQGNEIDFCHELAKLPRWRYYSTAGPLHESCHMTRAREERPPAGPEKYTRELGNYVLSKNVVTWATPMVLWFSAAANSFFDLPTRIGSDNTKKQQKNSVGPNEFTDF